MLADKSLVTSADTPDCLTKHEELLLSLENEIRNHVKLQNQLKITNETNMDKLDMANLHIAQLEEKEATLIEVNV